MIAHVLRRVGQMETLTQPPVLATDSWELVDKVTPWTGFIGHPEPLTRYVECVGELDLADEDYVVRITGDCPGLDPKVSDAVVRLAQMSGLPYASNVRDWPDGLDTEVFKVGWLRKADKGTGGNLREHVTQFMRLLGAPPSGPVSGVVVARPRDGM